MTAMTAQRRASLSGARRSSSRPGAPASLRWPALAGLAWLALAAFAPNAWSQVEPARPPSEEFETLVLQASQQVDEIRKASRSYYLDFQTWPGDIVDLIADGYLPEDFPPLTPWGKPFVFALAGDQLNIDVVVPSNEELSDLAERTETLDPTTDAEKTVTEDKPEYADDYFTQAATSVRIKSEITEQQPYDKKANREFERVAETLTITSDREYLDNVKQDIDTGKPPVGYIALDAGTEEEASIVTDRERLAFNRGGRFVGGLVVDVLRDSDAPQEWFLDLSGASQLNELSVSSIEDRQNPQYRMQLSGQSRLNALQASRLEADSAEIESADIVVLNGSAPINRGQLDTFAVTQLSAGENIVVDNPVGNVTVSIVDNPIFENVSTRGLARLNTLRVGQDANVEGGLSVGGNVDVSNDLFVEGKVVIGDDSNITEEYALYVEGDIGAEDDIFTDGAIRAGGAGGLVLDTNAIAHESDALVLRPNATASPAGGLELKSDGIDLSLLALGNTNLLVRSEGASMIFRNGRDSPSGFSFRNQNDESIVVVDTVNNRVGIGLGEDAPDSTLHVRGTIQADAFIGDGSGLFDVTAGALAGEGDLVIEAGTAAGSGGSIIFRTTQGSGDSETVARFSQGGNLGIGRFAEDESKVTMALSVGDDDRARFTVDRNGDIVSEGDLTVAGDVNLGDDAQDTLIVASESTFEADVQVNGAMVVVNDGFTGDLVTLAGGGALSDAGSVLVVEAETGFPEGNPVASIQRPGLGQVVGFSVGNLTSFGIYALDSTNTFRAAPSGSLAVGVSASGVAGRMFVMNGHDPGQEGVWQEVATSAQQDQDPVLNGGNDVDAPLKVGSTTAQPLQFITNDQVAMEIDENQNVIVSGGNQLRFRDGQARLSSPASGELLVQAQNSLTLSSPNGAIVVEARVFDVSAERININGELLVNSTLTVTGAAIFSGDVTLGDSSSDTVTILGSLQGLTFEGTQQGLVSLVGGDASGNDVTITLPSTSGILVVMEEPDMTVRLLGDLVVNGGVDVAGDSTFSGVVRAEGGLTAGGPTFISNVAPLSVEIIAPEGPVLGMTTSAGAGEDVTLYVFAGDENTEPLTTRAGPGSLALSTDGFLWLRTNEGGIRDWRRVLADGLVFQHGGNQFGEPAILGTADDQPLHLVSGGSVAVAISTEVSFFKPLVAAGGFVVTGTASFGGLEVNGIANLNGTVFLGDEADDEINLGGQIISRDDGQALVFRPTVGEGTLALSVPVLNSDVTVSLPNSTGELLTNAQERIIRTSMLADGAVTLNDIADGAINSAALMNDAITADKIANGAITADKIADGTITSAKFADISTLVIDGTQIADGAITADKIADGAITADKIADGTITASKFAAALNLSGSDIANGAIVSDHIANNAVTADKIADNAVTSRHILDRSIDAGVDIMPGTVIPATLADGAVGPRALATAAVGVEHIADGVVASVARAVLSPGAVGAEQLAQDAVGPEHIADGAVGSEQLAEDAVGNRQLVAGERYDRITRVGRLEDLEVDGPIHAALPLASAAGATLCLSGSAISQCSSLAALKTAVRPLDLGLETVLALRPRRFAWVGDGREDLGFLAEEVAAVDPLLAATDAEGRLVGVRYRQMSALLARAVQQQNEALGPLSEALTASGGHVGVGKAAHPDYRLDVAGAARAGLFVETSDRRLKRDVRPLSGAESLAALASVPGVRYRWNAEYRRLRPGAERRWQVGVIAQDVARALPDLVRQGADGYLTVSYDRFVPHLVGAVNTLSARLDGLRGALASAPGGLELRRPLRAGGRVALSPEGDVRARSLAVDADMRVGDRFALRRSKTLASLLRVDTERRADTEVEGYLSARDVYLADRGAWGSELDARVVMSDQVPNAAECVDSGHSGTMQFVASQGELYVCGGEAGWLSTPLASSDG